MKLLYRGIPYEVPTHNSTAPTSSSPTSQSKVRLIYRGNTYEYEPQPMYTAEAIPADAPTVTLIYRGQTYQRKLLTSRTYQQPRILNWRWQFGSPQSEA